MTEQFEQHHLVEPSPEAVGGTVVALETDPNLRRAAEVSLAIDPEGTLPEVEIGPDPRYRTPGGSFIPQRSLVMHNGREVGRCTLVTDKRNKDRWFNGIEVDQPGQGFGSAAYKAAIVDAMRGGYNFRTHDWSQTESAVKVWRRLAGKGVARVEEEFRPDGNGKFIGSYVIDAAQVEQ